MIAELLLFVVLIAVATVTAAVTSLRWVGRLWLRRWIDQRLAGGGVGDEEAFDRQQRMLEAGTAATSALVAIAGVSLALSSEARPGRLAIEALLFILALLLLGQLVPRAIARRRASRLLPALVPLLRFLSTALAPFVRAAHAVSRPFARQAGVLTEDTREDEIEDLLREGELEGIGEHAETEIIAGVVRFGEKTVAEMMTPRTAIVAVDEATHPRELARLIAQSGYSRIPVYRTSIDEVIGMVHVFDVLRTRGETAPELRRVMHAPATKRCSELLFEMLRERLHLSVVLDEYGGTAGLVTLEDLLEELVGDIRDEHDEPAPAAAAAPERALVADGNLPLGEALSRLGLPHPDDDAVAERPLGGVLTRALGRVPSVGERFEVAGVELTVIDAEPARVVRVLVTPSSMSASVTLDLSR